jgi:hypothetical protein
LSNPPTPNPLDRGVGGRIPDRHAGGYHPDDLTQPIDHYAFCPDCRESVRVARRHRHAPGPREPATPHGVATPHSVKNRALTVRRSIAPKAPHPESRRPRPTRRAASRKGDACVRPAPSLAGVAARERASPPAGAGGREEPAGGDDGRRGESKGQPLRPASQALGRARTARRPPRRAPRARCRRDMVAMARGKRRSRARGGAEAAVVRAVRNPLRLTIRNDPSDCRMRLAGAAPGAVVATR